jgi:hypothetical protein
MINIKSSTFFITIFLLQLLYVKTSIAQQDYQKQYISAKQLFNESKYNQAMEAFKPLIVYDKNNNFSEYASFYYAISAYQESLSAIAKDMLLQIKQIYPDWDQIKEVDFWLARIHFDNKEYFRGMDILHKLSGKTMSADIIKLKQHYFSKETSLQTLELLYKDFPNEPAIGKALARAIIAQPRDLQNKDLLEKLISKFSLAKDEFALAEIPRSVKKNKYTVAIMLPFAVNNLQPNLNRKPNQFVIDLYDGLMLGIDSLRKTGIDIDVLVFDTERSEKTTAAILEYPQLKTVDLIIGPLYRDPIKLVNEFAFKNKINVLSPLSNDSEVIANNPFAFLFNPSYETLAKKAAQFISAQSLRRNACMIIAGDQKKDLTMMAYFDSVASQNGIEIVASLSYSRETSQRISDLLATPTELDDKKRAVDFTLRKDSLGCIFVTTEDPLIYMKVVSSIEARGDSIQVIGHESWLESATIDFTSFERLKIKLLAPGFHQTKSSVYLNFQHSFAKRYGRLPNSFSRNGFELMMTFGNALFNHGNYFQHAFDKSGVLPGTIFSGYNYWEANDNQVVPVIRFRQGVLERLSN